MTQQEYFAPNNGVLTRSKIVDYLKCPNYFYRKHILCNVDSVKSDSFAVGGAVDDLLAQIEMSRDIVVFEGDRRTKDGKAEYAELIDSGKTIVTAAQYDQIINIADAVIKTSAYKELEKYQKQAVLEIPMKIGEHFNKIAGLPDFIFVSDTDNEVDIVDLKTSQTVDDISYYYHCKKYGYFTQAALYTMLAESIYPNKKISFKHLVAEKAEPFRVKVFLLPQSDIEEEKVNISNTIEKLSTDKEFKKIDASINNPTKLGFEPENTTIDSWENVC